MSEAATQALEHLEQRAQRVVKASALHGGTFTLPLKLFIADAAETDRSLVPSLSFLITHQDAAANQRTNIVFDLGLRRDVQGYIPSIQEHIQTRQPMDTLPDVRQSLEEGGVPTGDISHVILSHVHWDHTGTPADYPHAQFWVGSGALGVLENGIAGYLGHRYFESKLFDGLNVKEFPSPDQQQVEGGPGSRARGWERVGDFSMYDFMGDGSVYVVDAPGHLPGHVNLLARLGARRWIYLVGDACHDERLLTGEKGIAEWRDEAGHFCCIHNDKEQAEATLARIRDLQAAAAKSGLDLEVILAHGMDWAKANPEAFLPGSIRGS